jgi:PAS domain S-box-containing protein
MNDIPATGALILAVDDNEAGRYAKTRILKLAGFDVIQAANGEEALRLAAERHPELMLIDVRLPDLNGRHVSLRVKSDPATADIAVLQTSATHTDTRHKVLALEAGADAYLVEPVDPEELVANVRALLRMRRAEIGLKESERRFRHMAESIGDVFWILDPAEMKFEYVSPAFTSLWGRDARTLEQGMGAWIEAIHPEDRERAERAYSRLAAGGSYEEEFRIFRPDGSERWIANRGFPMQVGDGARRAAGVAQDITERKAAEATLRGLDKRKDEFLAMLAHELRNPLGPIRNAVEIMRMAPLANTEVHGKARDMIGRQVAHLGRLVDDLLDISRITQDKITLQKTPVKLEAAVNAALEVVRPSTDATGHRIEVRIPAEPIWIDADPVRLTQVIGNLLNNATKFTPPSGRIELCAELRGTAVAISVEDTGIGMSPDLVPHIFELFAQGDHSLERSRGGLGIGLSLVQRLVQLHGGTVSVSSPGVGQGSRFEVVLPVTQPQASRFEEPAPSGRHASRRILVVDDSRDSAEALTMILEQKGHRVETSFGSMDAMARAKAFVPEVIFLDIGLPEMDGYQLAKRLREMPETRNARILALTGYGQKDHRELALRSGFDDHLVKPFDPQQLDKVIG